VERKGPFISTYKRYSMMPGRRRFLQGSAAAIAGMALANCRQNLANVNPAGSSSTNAEAGASSDTLYIFTWANYTDTSLADAFTELTGIKVVIDIFDSNETMLTKMQAGGGSAYSIIYPSDYMVSEMISLGLLQELDPTRIQGLENLLDKWIDPAYDSKNAHSIPFSWGTTGLLYNREAVPGTPTDWSYLWENQQALSGQISMLDDMRETLGAVLKGLGYSYNSTDPAQLEEAYNKLLELKPHLASFKSSGFEDEILGGDLNVVMSYSSDAIPITLEDERMEYIIPASGSSLWTDTMAIPVSAPNVEAAYQWLNFILDPAVSKAAVERLFFATPNKAAYELLPDELKANNDLYPPQDILAKCEGIQSIDSASNDLFDQYWTQVVSA
jgi:spermidine/putrescine transport system substrate-binding protein